MRLFTSHVVFFSHVDNFVVNFGFISGVIKVVFPLVDIFRNQSTKDGSAGHIANCFAAEGGAGEFRRELETK